MDEKKEKMKILLTFFIVVVLISGIKPTDSCDYYKNQAVYWEKMSTLKDSCISLMDFKTYEAKAKVLRLFKKQMELTIKYTQSQ